MRNEQKIDKTADLIKKEATRRPDILASLVMTWLEEDKDFVSAVRHNRQNLSIIVEGNRHCREK